MYAVTSAPDVNRTRATLRRAEFGLRGVVVNTRVHTPRRKGEPFSAAVRSLVVRFLRPLRTSWAIVGTRVLRTSSNQAQNQRAMLAAHTNLRPKTGSDPVLG